MRRTPARRAILAVFLLACIVAAGTRATGQDGDEESRTPPGAVAYPDAFGPNLVAADRGGRVVDATSTAVGPDALLDGALNEGHYWQPDWQKGFPASFTISIPKVERIGRFQLSHRPDGAAPPREVEIWVGKTRESLRLVATVGLPNARTQRGELEPCEAAFVKVVIKSSYHDGQVEIGEFALFAPALARGSETKDLVEPKLGDRLLGELVTPSFAFRGRLGEVTVRREDLVTATLDDKKDGYDRAYLRTGEVVVGEMVTPKVTIKLDGGSVVEIPREKLAGLGARRGQGEFPDRVEELATRGHVLVLTDGSRALGKLRLDPVVVRGACGEVQIPLASVQAIDVGQGQDPLDRVTLREGDVLRGLVLASEVAFVTSAAGALRPVSLAKGLVARVVLAPPPDPLAPRASEGQRFVLRTGEAVTGSLALEKLRIRTAYATIDLDVPSFDTAEALEGGRLRIVLRDGGVVQGRPERDPLPIDLDAGGSRLLVPVDRIERIENHALPPELSKRIDDLLKRLDGEWPDRDVAQSELVKIGKPALSRLARAMQKGTPEVRARAHAAAALVRAAAQEPAQPAPQNPPKGE